MVKQLTVILLRNNSNDEITPQDEDIINVEEKYTVEEHIINFEDDTTRETEEINTNETLEDKPKTKGKHKILNNMPTTEQVISQVQCQACGKSMSAKNLKYSHAGYCIQRVQEVDKPKAIPAPKKILPKLKNILPVKGIHQDVESDDEEVKIFKGSIIPSDDIEIEAMTKLNNQITKAQEEYMINNKKSDLPMYNKPTAILRPEDIEPPLYEVRMKSARQKKQQKYDKLMSKAF